VLSATGLLLQVVSRLFFALKTKPRLNKTKKRMYCLKSDIKPKKKAGEIFNLVPV